MSEYPGRHRVKGGRAVHATRLDTSAHVGRQVTACGKRAIREEPHDAAVTCKACLRALPAPAPAVAGLRHHTPTTPRKGN